ncbi:MFS transporter [Reyranella sp.]|uniref:MFS transporter n=1 Tax=Reyranella sp. TaxID=1929291 RepID=UPI000BD2E4DF|nr:MFS transporter [Reyranella sp.]OYY47033.1 MAG: MFS transporter [Rhodospirillales bacterium 35-66-84]OYZ97053.1 MAG: MFS transporter [Rhodospirillales bacterium 24-66-33]OZB27619.1 MAG: MFS transporter [Rhodospirillales bacterium 39-66-50]HQS13966.1 MFS transporter [Reyranella sp.]HQT10451.1 MFS transporter [Reyranella sp.]
MAVVGSVNDRGRPMTREERKVIVASSVGTVFEWYDFYLAGALAINISANFFSGVNPTAGFIFTLLGFAAGFAVRPFGALFFGSLGDLIGRKYTFLVTMTLMGIATFVVGILPSYASIGIAAPILFIACRLLQGLALGGEYGGAATYVAEHAPHDRRGFYTSWIQTTATVGLFLSLLVVVALRLALTPEQFAAWGWRVPFLLSIILLGVSIWIRLQLEESPAFKRMKAEGKGSKTPLREAFGVWKNAKIALIALFGGTAGQAAVWYTGQFYALFFLTQTLKLDATTSNIVIAVSLLIGTPFFVFFGWLSDKIGRKPIILAGCALAMVTYFPLFHALTNAVNPALNAAIEKSPVVVIADPNECSFQFNPTGTASFTTSCDIAKSFLARNSVNYGNQAAPAGTPAQIKIGDKVITSFDKAKAGAEGVAKERAFNTEATAAIRAAGYPAAADPKQINMTMVIVILTILVIYVTMVYGPIAALLVELFPTRIRYSGMSLPYHIGNGWFGGFLPPTAFAIVAATGNIYSGLWYPIVVAGMTLVVGLLFMPETKDRDIYADD